MTVCGRGYGCIEALTAIRPCDGLSSRRGVVEVKGIRSLVSGWSVRFVKGHN